MTPLKLLAYLCLAAATVTAIALARRERGHRPIAVYLVVLLGSHLARTAIAPHLDASPRGWIFFRAEEALYLADPLSLAALSVVMLSRPIAALLAAPAWALIVAGLVAAPVDLTAHDLARVYLAVELATLLVCAGALVHAWRAGRLRLGRQHHRALAMIVVAELAGVMLGPWRYGIWERWDLAQVGQVVLFGVLTVLQGRALVSDPGASPR